MSARMIHGAILTLLALSLAAISYLTGSAVLMSINFGSAMISTFAVGYLVGGRK